MMSSLDHVMSSLDHVISLQDSVLSCDASGLKEAMRVRFTDTEQKLASHI